MTSATRGRAATPRPHREAARRQAASSSTPRRRCPRTSTRSRRRTRGAPALKLRDHARQVRDHITSSARSPTGQQFEPTPEFVVLFLPGETFFSGGAQQDPALIESASPAGDHRDADDADRAAARGRVRLEAGDDREQPQEISELGRELYKRIATLAEHFSKVGRDLGEAVSAYNQSVGSLETRVPVSARQVQGADGRATSRSRRSCRSRSCQDVAGARDEQGAGRGLKRGQTTFSTSTPPGY